MMGQRLEFLQKPTSAFSLNPENASFVIPFTLYNTSKDTLVLGMEISRHSLAEGHQMQFFWNYVCGAPEALHSEEWVKLAPGDTLEAASLRQGAAAEVKNYLEFTARDFSGNSTLTLMFFDQSDPDISVEVSVDFISGVTAINSYSSSDKMISSPYPNPADQVAYLDYELPGFPQHAYIKVINLLGREQAKVPLTSHFGTATIQTRELESGVYFLYVIADDKEIATKKLVVSR